MSTGKGSGWLVTPLLVLAIGAPGCSGRSGASGAYQDPHPLPADTMTVNVPEIGKHGGRFVIAQTSPPRTFNGIMANETSTTDLTDGRLFTTLVDFDNITQQDVPMVAKSWEQTPDGLTTTFHLRHGVCFSDGHPLTSEDFMFSVQCIMDPTLHPSMQDLLVSGGKPFEFAAPDSYTVVVKTTQRSAMLTQIIGSIRILPKHVLEGAFKAGTFASAYGVGTPPESLVTSGPWMLKQFVAGEKTVLTRNPYWFGVDAKGQRLPYLDELIYLLVPDQEAAALKFKTGEVDALDNVKPEDYDAYERDQKSGNYTLFDLGPALTTNFFWFNLNTVKSNRPVPGKKTGDPYVSPIKYAWFKNRDFRRAVSMAINRDDIIKGPLHGYAVKNWSTMTPGNKKWYSAQVVGADYDPEGAKKLLDQIGFKDRNGDGVREDPQGHPIAFTMKTNGDNKVRMSFMVLIQHDLSEVGIKMTPAGIDFNTLITNLRENLDYESLLLGLGSAVPPDPGMGQNVYRSSGPTHYWNIRQVKPESPEEARIDQLMDENLAGRDFNERMAAWMEMQKILNDQVWYVWLPSIVVKLPIRNTFGNLQPSIIPHRILWNIDRVYVKKPSNAT